MPSLNLVNDVDLHVLGMVTNAIDKLVGFQLLRADLVNGSEEGEPE